MEVQPRSAFDYPSRKFLFHSVISTGGHTKYYNVYQVGEGRFFAECHHFNRSHSCEGDFELFKLGDDWLPGDTAYEEEAQRIGEEIERMVRERGH